MLRRLLFLNLILIVVSPAVFVVDGQSISHSKGNEPRPANTAAQALQLRRSFVNINNLWLPVRNDGIIGRDVVYQRMGTYPRGLAPVFYCDQLIWTGKVKDGQQPELRIGGGYYNEIGSIPGAIRSDGVPEDPASESVRVFRYRPDFERGDLTLDASSIFDTLLSKVTPAMLAAVREQYGKDRDEWPWQKGAPYVDKNGNGRMDEGEMPGLQDADQVAWFSYNDLDRTQSGNFGGPAAGIEVQVTLWAYRDLPILQDVVFKRYRLIYRGAASTPANAVIDSMYVMQFADTDIGNAGDDLGGCDSLLGLGYAFNGPTADGLYSALGLPTPGIGFMIFQGPTVLGVQSDEAWFDFRSKRGVKNLPMSSFSLHITGNGDQLSPALPYSYFFWNVARGCLNYPTALSYVLWKDPDGKETRFMCAGDPVTRTGWYAGSGKWPPRYPGDVRIYLSSGPFTMAVGDTQEVVLAMIASASSDGPNNVAYLKYMAATLRGVYPSLAEYAAQLRTKTSVHPQPAIPEQFALHQNYPNPFNPSTRIAYSLPHESKIKLEIFDLLGREVRVLTDGDQQTGNYTTVWDGRDSHGSFVPGGVYFYRLFADRFQLTRKLLLIR